MFSSQRLSKVSFNSRYGRPTIVSTLGLLIQSPNSMREKPSCLLQVASSDSSPALGFETPYATRAHLCLSCQSSVLGLHAYWNHRSCVALAPGQVPGCGFQFLRVQGRGLQRQAAVGTLGYTVSGIHLQRIV